MLNRNTEITKQETIMRKQLAMKRMHWNRYFKLVTGTKILKSIVSKLLY